MKKLLMLLMVLFLSGCEIEEPLGCDNTENVTAECLNNEAPVITGIEDITITEGDEINLLDGVTALDSVDGDITSNIILTENVKTDKPGTYFVKYEIENSAGYKTVETMFVTVNEILNPNNLPNMVSNGDFSDGMTGFTTYTEDIGNAEFNVVNGEMRINILGVEDNKHYTPRLDYRGLLFERGATYKVTYRAKADQPRFLHFQIGELLDYSPWYFDIANFIEKNQVLETEYQTYSYTFTMNYQTNYNGALLFELGDLGSANQATTVYIDDIVVTKESEGIISTLIAPGRIEAEDFDTMEGIQTESTGDIDGNLNVGWFDAGDYIEYYINVTESGNYIIHHRIASVAEGANLTMTMDQNNIYELSLPNTNGWQDYQTVTSTSIYLEQGEHTFRITTTTGGLNINYFEFEKVN